jgi:hypothetical protein
MEGLIFNIMFNASPERVRDGAFGSECVVRPVNLESSLFFESPEETFRRVHREIRPRTSVPAVEVEYTRFADAGSRIRLSDGKLVVRITDILSGAPAPVLEALAHILIGKLYRRPAARQYVYRYRLYLNRKDVRTRIGLVRRTRGRKRHTGPEGAQHNLEQVFEKLNLEHFGGMMARPALGWSTVRSRTRLGHFDPSHNTIVVSRIFDDARVPRLALEYVMFHEMLHLHYPTEHKGARRCVHTPEFKAHEKLFPHYREAKALLKSLV